MSKRSFDEVRRAFERAGIDFEDHGRRARFEAERAIVEAHLKIAGCRAIAEALITSARRRRGGRDGGPIPRPGRKPRPSGGPSPQPVPVRPNGPNSLAGGAEAPLDF